MVSGVPFICLVGYSCPCLDVLPFKIDYEDKVRGCLLFCLLESHYPVLRGPPRA